MIQASRKSVLPLLAAGLGLALAACSAAPAASPEPVVQVQAARVRQGRLQQWVRTQAVLYPLRQAIITPKISAPVTRFYVQRGDQVRAGELLATLESRDLAAAAQQAAGELQTAEANYRTATAGTIPADLKKAQLDVTAAQKVLANARYIYSSREVLYRQGAIPRQLLDQAGVSLTNAENTYALARQHLQAMEAGGGHLQELRAAEGALAAARGRAAAAEATLAYSRLTSPINGVVTDRPFYTGELASPAAPLMTIMDLSQVVARASLPASQAALLQVGDPATIAPLDGGAPRPARVTVVSPATDPNSTTVEVWVQTANPGGALRPGTSVQVAVLARTLPHALLVPAVAVLVDYSGNASVMVIGADRRAHQTPVTLGVENGGMDQVLSGLAAGQRVVTVGAYGLPDDSRIQIVPSPPAGARTPTALP